MKPYEPLVSIVIPTYQRPEKAVAALQSAIEQDGPALEILIIDDNGKGCDEQIATSRALQPWNNDLRVRYIPLSENMGAPAARNTGIRESRGRYVTFLDDDDIYLPGKIRIQADALESVNPDAAFSYCALEYRRPNGRVLGKRRIPPGIDPLKTHLLKNFGPTSCIMVRRDVAIKSGGFADLPAGQDYEWQLRLLESGAVPEFISDILVAAYVHDDARISTGQRKLEAADRLWEIKNRFLHRLTPRERRLLEARYRLSRARALRDLGRDTEALREWRASFWLSPGVQALRYLAKSSVAALISPNRKGS